MITITTINDSWYFIDTFRVLPNASGTYDENNLTWENARDLIYSYESKRIDLSAADLAKIKAIEDALNPVASAADVNTKQDRLVSTVNIKSINGQTILGSGDLTVSAEDSNMLDGQDGLYYLDRANHTGEQPISSVTNLQTELDRIDK